MANKNGTGPEGKGPKTGRQMGKCESTNPINRNFRKGFGRNRIFHRNYWRKTIVLSKEERKNILEAEKAQIEHELKNL